MPQAGDGAVNLRQGDDRRRLDCPSLRELVMRRWWLKFGGLCLLSDALALAAVADPTGHDRVNVEPTALAGITAQHNRVRARVGVAALVWDAKLAASAQAWANRCVDTAAPSGLLDHNPDRSAGFPFYVGENIFAATGTASAQQAVRSWVAEAANFDYATNTCKGVCGHYTQVVWAKSVRLGCGISFCANLRFSSSIVCDYGPGGNSGGRPY